MDDAFVNKRLLIDEMLRLSVIHSAVKSRKCDHCVIVGAMRNTVQCCEWAGRYFMNGGDHVTAAPPEADISH